MFIDLDILEEYRPVIFVASLSFWICLIVSSLVQVMIFGKNATDLMLDPQCSATRSTYHWFVPNISNVDSDH